MLRKIKLVNFKCFENLELICTPLTLLCGLNGMGKSSVLQALLVLRQSFAAGELQEGRLVLSGEQADLGTGQDLLYEYAETDTDIVELELYRDDVSTPFKVAFDYSVASDQLRSREITDRKKSSLEMLGQWGKVPPLGGGLAYISAERIGPRKFYSLSETFARFGNLGARGEYALNYLHARREETLPSEDPRCSGLGEQGILQIIDFWLQEITPGAHLELETILDADAILSGFSFYRPGDVPTRRYRATNVGFGLSYALPVLTALMSPPGSLCLIENPEAHLHPRGQTKLADLAVRASLAGVQVIAETHSDHFIDGVRIAVRDGLILPDQAAFHYFERDGGKTVVVSPQVDADGRLSSWPAGFFDQHEENLARLLASKP